MLDVLEKGAGPAGDDDGGLRRRQLLLHGLLALLQVVGVHHPDPPDADAPAETLQIDLGAGVPLQVVAGGGVLLVAGHAGDGVIKNDDGGVGLVVGDVDEARDAGVHEGAVADDGHGLPLHLAAAGLVEAVEAGDGGAHADGGVDGAEGGHRAQGVAADIAQHRELQLI